MYGYHMTEDPTHKTTLYIGANEYRHLKALARAQGKPAAAVVREAIAEYTVRHAVARPRAFGAGRSGRHDLAEHAEDLLAGMGDNA